MPLDKVGVQLVAEGAKQAISDIDKFTKSLNNVQSTNSNLGKATKAINGLGLAVAGLAVPAITGAIAGVGIASVNTAMQINEATRDIQASLGLTADEAEALSDVSANVWADNFFTDINEATNAVIFAKQAFDDLNDTELTGVVSGAESIADTFDQDFNEIISASQTLVDNFGLSAEESLDLITRGFQEGLNRGDDFIDSITEYSGQFSTAGASATDFFDVLDDGLQGGVLGTDKIADAYKELPLRFRAGSDGLIEQLNTLGLSFDELSDGIASGELSNDDIFDTVINALLSVDESVANSVIQSGELGTQFEDLTLAGIQGFRDLENSFDDFSGATESLAVRYESFGAIFESFKRSALLAISPIGDAFLDLTNDIINNNLPQIEAFFDGVTNFISGFLSGFESEYIGFFGAIRTGVASAFGESSDITKFFTENLQSLNSGLSSVTEFVKGLIDPLKNVFGFIQNLVIENEYWKDILVAVGVVIATSVTPVLVGFVASIAPVVAGITSLVSVARTIREVFGDDLLSLFNSTKESFSTLGDSIFGFVSRVFDPLNGFLAVLDSIRNSVGLFLSGSADYGESLSTIGSQIKFILTGEGFTNDALTSQVNGIIDVFFNLSTGIRDGVIGSFNSLKNITFELEGVFLKLKTGTESIFNSLFQVISSVILDVVIPTFQDLAGIITGTIIPAFQEFFGYVVGTVLPTFANLFASIYADVIAPVVQLIATIITDVLIPVFNGLRTVVVDVIIPAIGIVIQGVWQNIIKPTFDALVLFINETLIPAFESFRLFIVETAMPVITQAIAGFWVQAKPIFDAVVLFLTEVFLPKFAEVVEFLTIFVFDAIKLNISIWWETVKLIFEATVFFITEIFLPTFAFLYTQFVEVWWPAISEAIRFAWEEVIKPVFDAVVAFVVESLLPTILSLYENWVNEWFPAIQESVVAMWETVKPLFESIIDFAKETIPKAITVLKDAFDTGFSAIKGFVDPVIGAVESLIGLIGSAIESFKNLPSPGDIGGALRGDGIPFIPGFADGVENFAGGLAIVGEAGRELVQLPNGQSFLVDGASLLNLPRGTDVYTNSLTERILSGLGNISQSFGNTPSIPNAPTISNVSTVNNNQSGDTIYNNSFNIRGNNGVDTARRIETILNKNTIGRGR